MAATPENSTLCVALAWTRDSDLAAELADRLWHTDGTAPAVRTRAALPLDWVTSRAMGPVGLATWAVQNCSGEEVQRRLLSLRLRRGVLRALVDSPYLHPKIAKDLTNRAAADHVLQSWLEERAAREIAAGDPKPSPTVATLENICPDVRNDPAPETAADRLASIYTKADDGKVRRDVLDDEVRHIVREIGAPKITAGAQRLIESLYRGRAAREVGVELAEVIGTLDPDWIDWTVFSYWMRGGTGAEVFTPEMVEHLMGSAQWRLLVAHRLSDIQFAEIVSRLKGSDRWYGIALANSRAQALVSLDLAEATRRTLAGDGLVDAHVTGAEPLLRWASGPDDPMIQRCIALAGPESLRRYTLGLWRDSSGNPILPNDIDAAMEQADLYDYLPGDLVEELDLHAYSLELWQYEIFSRLHNGQRVMYSGDARLRRFIWENFEAACGDPAIGLSLLLSGNGSLRDISRTVRRLRLGAGPDLTHQRHGGESKRDGLVTSGNHIDTR